MRNNSKKIKTNLELLTKSVNRPQTGDVFVFRPRDREYYFGVVVNSDIWLVDRFGNVVDSADWDVVLVYVFDQHSPVKNEIPSLDIDKLLLAPLMLDVWCWRAGYVESVGTVDLREIPLLPQHCFVQVPLFPDQEEYFVDEYGRRLSHRIEPCGIYGLAPFRGFDDEISRALSIPLVAD